MCSVKISVGTEVKLPSNEGPDHSFVRFENEKAGFIYLFFPANDRFLGVLKAQRMELV